MTAAAVLQRGGKLRFDHADVLLYDPVFANRATLRTSLEMMGFRRITAVMSLDHMPELIANHLFDLIVADVTQHTETLCRFVRALRDGKTCMNPFAHVVLMAWKLDNDIVRSALNCGADEFVTRPFSVSFLDARIKAATETRAPFIVTGDYVGPDRRRDMKRSGPGVPTFPVPNALRAKCRDVYDNSHAVALQNEIRAAKERVGADRIHHGSIRMPLMVRTLKQAFSAMDELEPGLNELVAIARETADRIHRAGTSDATYRVASALLTEATRACEGTHVAAHLDAAELLATELYLAANPTATTADLDRELAEAAAADAKRR